ncbi:DUF998 domain-containing protein [uncultured Catenibacterium sp.]|uniref:DUF998 domain-containing protein n=1 Tax=uncultured Catenibacterium sp. TaxID=286142 RepID=UPI0025DBE065|nr:DUF998 domain-containing protein [uncultured Catenibacterium sp.]
MKKQFINYCGLLGVIAFLSYTAAVIFSPLAYPGYNWMAQAVSDLSASNAPSLKLWNQLSSLYNVCTLVCAMMVCLGIQGKGNKLLRSGIYLFTIMEWVSAVGFGMFPLSESGYAGTFQDQMHMLSTIIVVLLSIISLALIIISGIKDSYCRTYSIFAAIALVMMIGGAVGINVVPKEYFGVAERLSVFAATGFNAVLGIELYRR